MDKFLNGNNKLIIVVVISASITVFMALALSFMLSTGSLSLSTHGFAVDSAGLIYVGMDERINVYKDKNVIRTIDAQTSRDYAFTVRNNRILLSTSLTVYEIDLEGNIISKHNDIGAKEYSELSKHKKEFVDENGNRYILKTGIFRRSQIIRIDNGQVLYNLPMKDYLSRIMLFIIALCIIVSSSVSIIVFRGKHS